MNIKSIELRPNGSSLEVEAGFFERKKLRGIIGGADGFGWRINHTESPGWVQRTFSIEGEKKAIEFVAKAIDEVESNENLGNEWSSSERKIRKRLKAAAFKKDYRKDDYYG